MSQSINQSTNQTINQLFTQLTKQHQVENNMLEASNKPLVIKFKLQSEQLYNKGKMIRKKIRQYSSLPYGRHIL